MILDNYNVQPIVSGLTVDIEEIKTACRQLKIDPDITYIETGHHSIYLHWSESMTDATMRQMGPDPNDCIDFYDPLYGWSELDTKMIPTISGHLIHFRYILCTK
tara:strand:+ start:86 stop:397 length:312 start_codon:yes stop_codon:yes gene_type:complete